MKLLEKHGNRAPITHPSRAPELASFQIQRNPFQIPRKASKSFPTLPNLSKSKKNLSKPPENFANPSKSKENLSKYQKIFQIQRKRPKSQEYLANLCKSKGIRPKPFKFLKNSGRITRIPKNTSKSSKILQILIFPKFGKFTAKI